VEAETTDNRLPDFR